MCRSRAVGDPAHAGKSLARKLGDLICARAVTAGGAGKAHRRTPVIDADEKSDTPILPMKLPNKGSSPAEAVEGRGVAKGNADQTSAPRTQSRTSCAAMGLESVREVARRDRRGRVTALLPHFPPSPLVQRV